MESINGREETSTEDMIGYSEKDFEYEESEEQDSQAIPRYSINSYTMDRPVETLIKWKENGKLVVPDFQRDYVWSYNNCCRFIESILLNLPIPGIFVFKLVKGQTDKYLLVDGMQRVTTIEQFFNGSWEQKNGKKLTDRPFRLNISKSEWDKKSFSELSEEDQQFFLDYSFSVTFFESAYSGQKNDMSCMFKVFERLNTGATKLSDQEIRNAIYQGKCLQEIQKCLEMESFNALICNDRSLNKRGYNIELYLRFICYSYIYNLLCDNKKQLVEGYTESAVTTSKIEMLNMFLYYANNGKVNYSELINQVDRALVAISEFSANALYAKKRESDEIGNKVHQIFAEALIIATIANQYKIDIDCDCFERRKIDLWNSEYFYDEFVSKTTSPENIKNRVSRVLSLIRGE